MFFLHSVEPQSIALTLGGLTIHWYGIILSLALLAGLILLVILSQRSGLPSEKVFDLALMVTVAGFIGARLYHVLNEPSYYWNNPGQIFQIWNGGLAIHGGIIFGGLALLVLARRAKLSLAQLADIMAPALLIAQAIGRWGNYMNQELFGRATNLPWGIPIAPQFRPDSALGSTYFHPVFLYEFLFDLIGSIMLTIWYWRKQDKKYTPGTIAFAYMIIAGLGRILVEFFRIDQTPHILGVRLPLLISALFVCAGAAGLLWLRKRRNLPSR